MTNVLVSYSSSGTPQLVVEEYSLPSGSIVKRNGNLIDYHLMGTELKDGDEMILTYVFKNTMKRFHTRTVVYRGLGTNNGVQFFKFDDANPKKKKSKNDE